MYYPSRKNTGIFITMLFVAGGSDFFQLPSGIVTANRVETQRKIYNGSFEFTPEQKLTFHPVDIDGLTAFFEKAIPDNNIEVLIQQFGIPDDTERDTRLFLKALAYQFEAFVHSSTQEADDIVQGKYEYLLEHGDIEAPSTDEHIDKIGVSQYQKAQHRVNCYDSFRHTWVIENKGTEIWENRRLFLRNSADIKLKIESVYVDVPVTKPGERIKITTGGEARGQEGMTVFNWIMVDDAGNNCFPDDSSLSFTVEVKFETSGWQINGGL